MSLRSPLALLAAGALLLSTVFLFQACRSLPPRNPDDACDIFDQRPNWREAAHASSQRWGVPESLVLAVLHQESRFRPRARPGRRRFLGVIPLSRLSSAYGYGQVKDGTWSDYVKEAARSGASREKFADVADFIGWYAGVIGRTTGIAPDDAYNLYLAYHEGPAGFARGSHADKPWLLGVARKVANRENLYARQLAGCPGELGSLVLDD